jgi:hypothetical protein
MPAMLFTAISGRAGEDRMGARQYRSRIENVCFEDVLKCASEYMPPKMTLNKENEREEVPECPGTVC